jgi:hypothetical protein
MAALLSEEDAYMDAMHACMCGTKPYGPIYGGGGKGIRVKLQINGEINKRTTPMYV